MKPVRTGTRTGWSQRTGGRSVCGHTLLQNPAVKGNYDHTTCSTLRKTGCKCSKWHLLLLGHSIIKRFDVTGGIIECLTSSLEMDQFPLSFICNIRCVCLRKHDSTTVSGDRGEMWQHCFGSGRPTCGVRERVLFNRRKKHTSKREKPG